MVINNLINEMVSGWFIGEEIINLIFFLLDLDLLEKLMGTFSLVLFLFIILCFIYGNPEEDGDKKLVVKDNEKNNK